MHFEAKPSATEAEAGETVVRVVTRMAELPADAWNALAGESPFLQHAFLQALEDSECVGAHIGWEPVHLALFRGSRLEAAMPLYVKH
ncbi:MAG: peptidogalycan biosysnthesis protein, partial [Thiobacillus sp.]